MDSLSHALTGALVADALPFTKRLGPKAPLAAALAAAAPDLDMAPAFIANFPPKSLSFWGLFDMRLMYLHRTYTHSFFYMFLACVPLGLLAWWWGGKRGKWPLWALMLLLALFSHTILDLTNPWGVRAWLPFSPSRSALNVLPLTDIPILAVAAAVFLLNHVFRNAYALPDTPQPPPESRRARCAAFLDRHVGATTVGMASMALVLARIGWALWRAPTLTGWF